MGAVRDAVVRLVARVPVPVRRKLLVAFGAVVCLLVLTAAIGAQALAQSNGRTETLGRLQRRVSVYRQLQNDTTFKLYSVASALADNDARALDAAERQLNQAYDFRRLEFLARDEGPVLAEIQTAYSSFVTVMTEVIYLHRQGALDEGRRVQRTRAEPVADTLVRLTNGLVNKAESGIATLVDENEQGSRSSRRLFIAFAAGGTILALVLGFAISMSIIDPVTRMNRRLAALASGNFSQRVEVDNHDELGDLAANLNRMSEELGRLYQELAELNRDLEARVAEQVQELRASRARVVTAADSARRHIERDLHDGAQQQLVALAVNLRLARDLVREEPAAATEVLEELASGLQVAIAELRDLAHGIYPPLLVDSGLPEALRAAAARSSLAVTMETDGVGRYRSEIEAAVYFCCLEALQNAAKHAPGACVTVTVREDAGELVFEVADDGPGFEPEAAGRGHGWANMSDRLGAVGGRVQWDSAPGQGTRVRGTVPINP